MKYLRKCGIKDLLYSCMWMGFQFWHFCILFLTTTELLVQFFLPPHPTILCQIVVCTALLTQNIFYKTSVMVFLWCIVCISNVSEHCWAEKASNTYWATVYELQQISHSSHSKTDMLLQQSPDWSCKIQHVFPYTQ
jgi:hypothetical protein